MPPRPPSRLPRRRTAVAARTRRAALAVAAAAAAVTLLVGCRRQEAPPAAEFVVTAGDSSFWVRSGPGVSGGVSLRRAPIILARVGGRFHELYVTDEEQAFYDAHFASQTVWRRDLVTGDSTIVFADELVPRLASRYAAAHREERPLEPDEEGAEEPVVSASLEVTLGDVVGPYLAIETFVDLHPEHGPESHRLRRGVVDLRTGGVVSLAKLVGDSIGARVTASGRAAFSQARDSLRRSRSAGSHRAATALDHFAFDEHSFVLTRLRRQPGVVFYVPGEGGEADGWALPLAPIPLPAGSWWHEASASLSLGAAGDGLVPEAWVGPAGYGVYARPVPAIEGEGVTLVLRELRSGSDREWPLGRIGVPAEHIYWLDAPPISLTERRALGRAFQEASFYDGSLRAASAPRARDARPALRLAAQRGRAR